MSRGCRVADPSFWEAWGLWLLLGGDGGLVGSLVVRHGGLTRDDHLRLNMNPTLRNPGPPGTPDLR